MPPPSPKAKMLESLRIPDGEGMPSPYNTTIRYAAKQLPYKGGRFVNRPYDGI